MPPSWRVAVLESCKYPLPAGQKRERTYGNCFQSIRSSSSYGVSSSHYKECKTCENKPASDVHLLVFLEVLPHFVHR